MGTADLNNEIKSFRQVLQKGKLSEIDLDALGDCLAETECRLDALHEEAENLKLLRDDVISEIVKFSRAAEALMEGSSNISHERISAKLAQLDAKKLLSVRDRARSTFRALQRGDALPRKTVSRVQVPGSLADYKLEHVRV